jgi:hypothetical protein
MRLNQTSRKHIRDEFFVEHYLRTYFPHVSLQANNMSFKQKLNLLRKYKRGGIEQMELLDYELFYTSTECYYTYPEFSYFNAFEYDATVFTSYISCTEDVDLIAHFT